MTDTKTPDITLCEDGAKHRSIGVKLGDVEVRLAAGVWIHHSTFVQSKIETITDSKCTIVVTFQSPKSLLVIGQLLQILQTSSNRAQLVAPNPSRAPLESIYQWNGAPDTELISFLTSTFPIPCTSEQRALLCDTMNLCSELGMATALDVFCSYFAFEHEYQERAQHLATITPKPTSMPSQQQPIPSSTQSTPQATSPMEIVS